MPKRKTKKNGKTRIIGGTKKIYKGRGKKDSFVGTRTRHQKNLQWNAYKQAADELRLEAESNKAIQEGNEKRRNAKAVALELEQERQKQEQERQKQEQERQEQERQRKKEQAQMEAQKQVQKEKDKLMQKLKNQRERGLRGRAVAQAQWNAHKEWWNQFVNNVHNHSDNGEKLELEAKSTPIPKADKINTEIAIEESTDNAINNFINGIVSEINLRLKEYEKSYERSSPFMKTMAELTIEPTRGFLDEKSTEIQAKLDKIDKINAELSKIQVELDSKIENTVSIEILINKLKHAFQRMEEIQSKSPVEKMRFLTDTMTELVYYVDDRTEWIGAMTTLLVAFDVMSGGQALMVLGTLNGVVPSMKMLLGQISKGLNKYEKNARQMDDIRDISRTATTEIQYTHSESDEGPRWARGKGGTRKQKKNKKRRTRKQKKNKKRRTRKHGKI